MKAHCLTSLALLLFACLSVAVDADSETPELRRRLEGYGNRRNNRWSGCLQVGGQCTKDGDCCYGMECRGDPYDKKCFAPCRGLDGSCDSKGDCCDDMECDSYKKQCHKPCRGRDQTCDLNALAGCCDGMECDEHTKQCRKACVKHSKSCDQNDDCCDGMECHDHLKTCYVNNEKDSYDVNNQKDAYGNDAKDYGEKKCASIQQLCERDGDCCFGLSCDGFRKTCAGPNAYIVVEPKKDLCGKERDECKQDGDCCSDFICHAYDFKCVADHKSMCMGSGADCYGDSDCCDKLSCDKGICCERK
eukprot:gb/GEZN01008884.1/.p1 GENE.gb/GEZN01008884.1/~~gb/GEZN01008884.1/.p1  ORF type:complete len:303 (+),score=27.69 gb/GEZN01008884.1/:154-1062(+)